MKTSSIRWVYLAAFIAIVGVVIYGGAIFGGPSWFAFFNAPLSVVASAQAGPWLAPVSALLIAGLMAVCAPSVPVPCLAGLIAFPLQRTVLACIAAVCLLRALILPPLGIGHPELRNAFEVVSAIVWFLGGVGFAVGFHTTWAAHHRIRIKEHIN